MCSRTGVRKSTGREDRKIRRHSSCESGKVESQTGRERVVRRDHQTAMAGTVFRGGFSVAVPDFASSVWAGGCNAPVAGQNPASPACSPSRQPVFAKQREPLRAWFGCLLFVRFGCAKAYGVGAQARGRRFQRPHHARTARRLSRADGASVAGTGESGGKNDDRFWAGYTAIYRLRTDLVAGSLRKHQKDLGYASATVAGAASDQLPLRTKSWRGAHSRRADPADDGSIRGFDPQAAAPEVCGPLHSNLS
jgi:hypothetical protein